MVREMRPYQIPDEPLGALVDFRHQIMSRMLQLQAAVFAELRRNPFSRLRGAVDRDRGEAFATYDGSIIRVVHVITHPLCNLMMVDDEG
jgi:hypothetical protein